MVDYAKSLPTKIQRQRCAETIVQLMMRIQERNGQNDDLVHKAWNHFAAIAGYDIDIDYPVDIERLDDSSQKRENIPYPQQRIEKRHYGALVERLIASLMEMEDGRKKDELIRLTVNQMKRNLGLWNSNAMTDEVVLEDLSQYTEGRIELSPEELDIVSDDEVITGTQQHKNSNGGGKKKKKK